MHGKTLPFLLYLATSNPNVIVAEFSLISPRHYLGTIYIRILKLTILPMMGRSVRLRSASFSSSTFWVRLLELLTLTSSIQVYFPHNVRLDFWTVNNGEG
ncbi:hypothetical protein EGR_10374 [Echinococcus granulosus]|uniref:Uncharacterized protein n=1 Tax=Echinococcus granulosus TaxID=6210 RepID=W6U0X9_ECHGR|nr:hypothetical protein EGR_10374 [Echinococcus granulosus]EUB54775.1 hypothetical protein EGR_10374 [Echinococcus granulosus]